MSEELRGTRCINRQKPKNKDKNAEREEVQTDLLHDLPDCPQEFRENLVDESSPFKPRRNPNCDLCLKTKNNQGFLHRRRAGTVVPRADIISDLKTADHQILCEER